MRIAVNTRLLLKNKLEGIGVFSYEILKRITVAHPEHEFVFLFDRKYDEEFIFSSNITPVVISPQARHPFLFYAWFEFAVPAALRKHQADLFVSPDGYLSLSTQVKSLAVIHDLNFEHYPEFLSLANRTYYRYFFPRFARRADRIVTVSEFSKKDIHRQYEIENERIDVVYNAAAPEFKPLEEEERRAVREKYSEGKPYFLFVGSLHQRKNIATLIHAFDLYKGKTSADTKLVLAGSRHSWDSEMQDALDHAKHRRDIVFTGRIEKAELCRLTASAFAATYVPLFEGFGIPVVEAMQCAVPVIAADNTSLPEVGGDAALFVDARSAESIALGMESMYRDEQLRNTLILNGNTQCRKFSWDRSAEVLWKSIDKTMA